MAKLARAKSLSHATGPDETAAGEKKPTGRGNGHDVQWPLTSIDDATLQAWRTWSSLTGSPLRDNGSQTAPFRTKPPDGYFESESVAGGAPASIDRLFPPGLAR